MSQNHGIQVNVKVTQYDVTGAQELKHETKPYKCKATGPKEARAECIAFGESFAGPHVNDIEVFNEYGELIWYEKLVPNHG